MASRLSLSNDLKNKVGLENRYFQPPESVKMHYPCAVYKRTRMSIQYANDQVYRYKKAYEIEIIDPNPDSEFIDRMLLAFPYISYARHFVYDNLNHDVFIVYY